MLQRFGTLYVGQVHHEKIGFDAPAVNDRWYDDETLASPLGVAEELAVLMDTRRLRHPLARRAPLPAGGLRVHTRTSRCWRRT